MCLLIKYFTFNCTNKSMMYCFCRCKRFFLIHFHLNQEFKLFLFEIHFQSHVLCYQLHITITFVSFLSISWIIDCMW
jgi:hypothetical protein